MRPGWAAVLVLLVAAFAGADDAAGPWGLRVGNGTRADLDFPAGSAASRTDDFAFEATQGQRIDVRVASWERRDTRLLLFRGDGTPVTASDGAVLTPRADSASWDGRLTYTPDATDTYRVRLASSAPAADPSSGPGRVRLVFRQAPRPAKVALVGEPGPSGEFRFRIALRGGARLTLDVRPAGGTIAARDVTDPEGRTVPGAVSAFRTKGANLRLERFTVPEERLFGEYEFAFDSAAGDVPAEVRLVARVAGGEPPVRKRVRLGTWRPGLVSVSPSAAIEGTLLTFRGDLVPPGTRRPKVRLALGGHALTDVAFPDPNDPRVATGRVPPGLPRRTWDAVAESATGQVAALGNAVATVRRPAATSVDPPFGPSFGGFEATIRGTGFRVGRIGIRIDGLIAPAVIRDATPTSVRFVVPAHPDGRASFGVADLETGAVSDLEDAFEFTTDPVLTHVEPPLVPELGGVDVTLRGGNFFPGTHVFLESDGAPGTFADVTPGGAYVNGTTLRFSVPVRARGTWRLFVRNVDDPGGIPSRERELTHFSFADATASLGLAVTETERFEAWTSALADFDGDGDEDLFLTRRGATAVASSSETRVLRNDGAGALADVTASVMPAPLPDDDWRADRLVAADLDEDGRPDLVLATNDRSVPGPQKSHVRILRNEARAAGAEATDRVYRDRTGDLFPPPRTMTRLYPPAGTPPTYVSDDWRGLDLWVGDLDASGGRPEIVLTHDETKEDSGDGNYDGVSCAPYCASPYAGGYAYRMYWGGTRAFRWDPAAAGGRGRYRHDPVAFPRRAAITIWIYGAPPGVNIPICNGVTPCRGTFLPLVGTRLAVGRIDGDADLDVAVLHDGPVSHSGAAVSPLQVVLCRSAGPYASTFADATAGLTAIGTDLAGTAVVAGRVSDDPASGSIVAVARASAASGSALRVFRHVPGEKPTDVGTFEEITATALPPASGDERWQADTLEFRDVDGDGVRDLVLLSAAAAPSAGTALRVLRGEVPAEGGVRFFGTLTTMLAVLGTPSETFDGVALALGDLDGDGLSEIVVSRAAPSGPGTQTRAVRIAR